MYMATAFTTAITCGTLAAIGPSLLRKLKTARASKPTH